METFYYIIGLKDFDNSFKIMESVEIEIIIYVDRIDIILMKMI
jgi:hypothetical protein